MAAADAPDHARRPLRSPRSDGSRWWARLDQLSRPGGLLLLSAMVIAALPVTSPIRDPDFWWHLRTGQLILDNHLQLLGTDPYTYTVPGHVWTMHEWLTEVLFALWYRAGGLGLIVLVLSAVTWLGVLCLLMRARLDAPNRVVMSLGILLGVVAGYPIWGPRAQMITFALSCLLLLVLERYLRRGGRILWLLPPLFLVWSNLHSGFIIGLVFAVIVIVAETAGRFLGFADPAPARRIGGLSIATAGSAVAAMINPNGPGIVLYPFATQFSGAQQELILEWHSPDFHGWEVRGFAVMLVSLLAMIIINRRIRARDAALIAVTAVLSFQSVRNIALFVAAATPIWIGQLNLLLTRRGLLESSRARPLPPLRLRILVLAVIGALLTLFYAVGRLVPAVAVTPASLGYARDYPVCAARWLALAPHSLRVFNQYGEGGYLAWSLAGTGDKVFVFGDAALMGDDLLYTYGAVEAVRPDWESILTRYGTDVVLFDTGTPLVQVIGRSPRWVRVYEDAHNQAFVRRSQLAGLNLPPQPKAPADPADACAQLAARGLGPP
jgi:hypothetical protein